MSTLLESALGALTPEMKGAIGKSMGVDEPALQTGFDVAGPLALNGLARKAKSQAGLDAIVKVLNQAAASGVGEALDSLLKGGLEGAMAVSGLLDAAFGSAASAIAKTLSAALGYDATALLALAVSLVSNAVAGAAKAQNLEPAGIARLLDAEQAGALAAASPAAQETLRAARDAGDKAESMRSAFSDDEWSRLRRAPIAAAFYVVSAAQSGTLGTLQELAAAGQAMTAALAQAPATSLVNVVYGNAAAASAGDMFIDEKTPRDTLLELVKGAGDTVAAKLPAESAGLAAAINALARHVAEAVKEGGFLGIGGTRVSAEEQRALDEIASALAARPPAG